MFISNILYIFFKKTAHRMIGYFEEEAVMSYSEYLAEIDNGKILNRPAPQIAIDYWSLGTDATLRDKYDQTYFCNRWSR